MVKHSCNVVPSICRASVMLLVVGAGCGRHGPITGHPHADITWEQCIGTKIKDWSNPETNMTGDPGGQGIESLGVGFFAFPKGDDGRPGFLRVDRFDTNRVYKDKQRIDILEVDHKQLLGRDPQGHLLHPHEWKGVKFFGLLNCPNRQFAKKTIEVLAKINGATPFADPESTGTALQGAFVYDLTLRIKKGDRWQWVDACGEEQSQEPDTAHPEHREVLALRGAFEAGHGAYKHGETVSGSYNPTPYLSFACKRKNAAKCQNLGYLVEEKSNAAVEPDARSVALFESCVRAMKADFCATGDSCTVNGKRILIWDTAGINTKALLVRPWGVPARVGPLVATTGPPATFSAAYNQFEAAWQPTGALCASGYYRADPTEMEVYQREAYLTCKSTFDDPSRKCVDEAEARATPHKGELVFTSYVAPTSAPPSSASSTKPKGRVEPLGIRPR